MLPVLFVAAFFITQHLLVNQIKINKLNEQITEQTQLLHRNQAIVSKISNIKSNIANFAQTQTILDSASTGTGVWSNVFSKISNYFGSKKDMWLTNLSQDANNVILRGYSENKSSLTDFAYYLKSAELKSVTFEALREKNAYKFNLTFNKNSYQKNQHE
jgi:Tfp pilus assembly protein PilN